jgi:hypothetical protein
VPSRTPQLSERTTGPSAAGAAAQTPRLPPLKPVLNDSFMTAATECAPSATCFIYLMIAGYRLRGEIARLELCKAT